MKRVLLVMVVSAMLVTLGLAQTPDASSNTGPASVNGCLGGSEGNYTVVEDGTGQLFKIASSSIDLKAHLGHDVKLTGHKAAGAANSLTASEVSMISEHCAAAAAAAAAPAAVVDPSPQTSIPPDTAAAAPATASAPAPNAAAPPPPAAPAAATVTAPVVEPAAPASPVTPESAAAPAPAAAAAATPPPATPPPATTPAVETAAPAAAVSPSAPAVTSRVVEEAAPAPRPSSHAHKLAAKRAAADAATDTASAATVSPSPNTTTPAAQDAATPATAAASSAGTVTPPDAPAVAPAPVTHRAGSLTLLIAFVVLVVVLGTTAPLIGRWRKRKMLERDGTPNLSFTNEVGMHDVIADEASTNEANTARNKQEPRKIA